MVLQILETTMTFCSSLKEVGGFEVQKTTHSISIIHISMLAVDKNMNGAQFLSWSLSSYRFKGPPGVRK